MMYFRFAGMQAKTMKGYSKHSKLEAGDDPKSADFHTWITVVVNKEWRLVDPHWGSSYITGGGSGEWLLLDDDGKGQDLKEMEVCPVERGFSCDESYFLTNPEEFIYSHFPEDEAWQFLARPVTLREFVDMAYLKPTFFTLDLRLLEHRKCKLNAPEGEIEIRIGTPKDGRRNFMYRLWISNEQEIGNVKLARYCIMEQKNHILICRIHFPVAGKFKFGLYGRDPDDSDEGSMFGMACTFIIYADKPAEDVKALPENVRQEWGPGPDLEACGITPVTHEDAIIEAEDGTVEVRFKVERPVEIIHNLHSNDKSKEELKAHVVHYMQGDEVVVKIKLPESGDYALNLFAKDEGKEGALANVCSYVVTNADTSPQHEAYPTLSNGRLGTVANSTIGIELISHPSPLIQCPDTGELELTFKTSKPCETIPQLELFNKEGNTNLEGLIWSEYNGNESTYKINFPEPGTHVFQLFAKEEDTEGTFPLAYTCFIDVPVPKEECLPFPKTFSSWGKSCKIIAPTTSVVPGNTTIPFIADIPHAHQVAVISKDGWIELKKNEQGLWAGDVEAGDAGNELKLSAEIEEGSNSYTTMLMYQVMFYLYLKVIKIYHYFCF